MAFRRFNNSRRGSSGFRSRRRFSPTGNARKTVPTRRYEWGEFFFESPFEPLPDVGETTSVIFTRLASTRGIGQLDTGGGRALVSACRHIDVGGVVLDYGISPASGPDGDDLAQISNGRMYCMQALVIDRMDSNGVPNGVAQWDPFDSSTPVVTVTATTPLSDTLDIDRPIRMLWQHTWCFDFVPRRISGDEEGVLYVPNDQRVETSQRTLNKRLKCRLTDDLGLYFVRAFRAGTGFFTPFVPLAASFARGSIYYRFAF